MINNYSNGELSFRIVLTFIEGFIGSLYIGTNGFQNINDKETLKSIIIGSVASGISGVVNLIKLIVEDTKEKNIVSEEEVNINE